MSVLLELPVPVVEGADLSGLQPAGDAVEVEGMIAPGFSICESRFLGTSFDSHAPCHGALLTGGGGLVCLALDAQVHDMVPGNIV